MKTAVLLLLLAASAVAQTFTSLASFSEPNGSSPQSTLIQGADGSLYGTAIWGGDLKCNAGYGCGTIFKITADGEMTTLYTFCSQPNCTDGAEPQAALTLATDGDFYGTTFAGGTGGCSAGVVIGCGTVFRITPEGDLTTLYNLCSQPNCTDGAEPLGALVQAANGRFYGTTSGTEFGPTNYGTIFEITAEGDFTTLLTFDFTDGAYPASREGLIQTADGAFYGTTAGGGAYGNLGIAGTVFKITSEGTLTSLYSFCAPYVTYPNCVDGSDPESGLFLAATGNFYGTTWTGGAYKAGTLFQVSPKGKLTSLYSFCTLPSCVDGAIPYGRVIQATDGNIYGTTYSNGMNGGGTIFEMTPARTFRTLYNFCAQPKCEDGASPFAGLFQSTNGKFYGTTCCGGTYGLGTVFNLDMGLGPFVTFVSGAGKVGQAGGILGQGFTGTTSVELNGAPAAFKVVSDTFIKATVPPGATTGYVIVTTPSGVLKSNVPFHVIP